MSCAFIKVRRAVVCSAMRAATVARRVGGWGRGLLRGGGRRVGYRVRRRPCRGRLAVRRSAWLYLTTTLYVCQQQFCHFCNFLFALHMQHISAPPCVPFHHARPPPIRTGHTRRPAAIVSAFDRLRHGDGLHFRRRCETGHRRCHPITTSRPIFTTSPQLTIKPRNPLKTLRFSRVTNRSLYCLSNNTRDSTRCTTADATLKSVRYSIRAAHTCREACVTAPHTLPSDPVDVARNPWKHPVINDSFLRKIHTKIRRNP